MADIPPPPPPPPGFSLVESQAAVPPPPPPPPGFKLVEPAPGSLDDPNMKLPPLTAAPPGAGKDGLTVNMKPERSFMDVVKSAVDTAGGYGTQGLIGVRKGVSAIAGLPGDLLAGLTNAGIWAARQAGADVDYQNPAYGSANVDKVLASPARVVQAIAGVPQEDTKPRNIGEAITRRVGEEVGATAVPVVGAIAKGARVGVEGARELPAIQRMFVEPAAIAPGRFARKEIVAAVAAGGGAGAVNTMLTDKAKNEAEGKPVTTGQQLGDLGGAVGGLGVAGLGGALGRALDNVSGAIFNRTGPAERVAREVATDDIVRAANLPVNKRGAANTESLVQEIELSRGKFNAIPGYQPTTADATGNSGIAERTFSRTTGTNSGAYKLRYDQNTEAGVAAMEDFAPTGQQGVLRSTLEDEEARRLVAARTELGNRTTAAGQKLAVAEDEAQTAVAPLTPRTTPAQRGNAIRTEQQGAADVARQATRDAYDNADINGVPLTPTHLAEALDRTTAGLSQVERSMAPQGLIDRVAQLPPGEPTTLREATSLRTLLLDQQRAAQRDPGRRYEARILGQYIEAVEDVIGQSVSPAQRAALDEARIARRTEADSFERRGDPVRGILQQQEGGGRYTMNEERVARQATDNSVIGRLLENADTPTTRQAIRDELLSNADTSSAAGLYRFQQEYAPQLARFPGINDELGAAIQARVRETTARGEAGALPKEATVETPKAVQDYMTFGVGQDTRAMANVFTSKDPAKTIDDLLNYAGNDIGAVNGARKAFWDILERDTRSQGSTTATAQGAQPYQPAALKKFLDDPARAAVAARLYRDEPGHLENLRRLSDTFLDTNVASRGRITNSSGTPQGMKSILPSTEVIASRTFAVQRGQVGLPYVALNVASIIAKKAIARQQAGLIDKIIDKALLEPEFAAQLLRENNPANRAALARGARGWLGNEASTIVEMLQPDDPDAEIKKAATR